MAKIVKFLGKPGKPGKNLVLEGLGRWTPGEERVFDDDYAHRFGFDSGDDYALFYTTVFAPMFEQRELDQQSSVDQQSTTGE